MKPAQIIIQLPNGGELTMSVADAKNLYNELSLIFAKNEFSFIPKYRATNVPISCDSDVNSIATVIS